MIRLHLDAAEHDYSPLEGVVFTYRLGTSADAIKSRIDTRDADGRSDVVDAALQFVARCVTGVAGIADADGKPIEWPSLDGKDRDAALRRRVAILNACPDEWVLVLHSHVNRTAGEADASGKG